MDEDGLELALEEVDREEQAGQGLEIRRRRHFTLEEGVYVGAQDVEDQGVDEQRAEIFDDVDRAPCDLGTWKDY